MRGFAVFSCFFFQAEDGIRDLVRSRGLGDVYKRQALDRVENHGIVFIDEIDKIAGEKGTSGPDVSRQGVQRDLLPIVEGSTVQTRYGHVRTDHILFVAAGAFLVTKPSDLIPELQGRFPIRVELEPLTEKDFVRILTEPENALTKQYAALVESEGASLTFTEDGVAEIHGGDEKPQAANLLEYAAHPGLREELWEEAVAFTREKSPAVFEQWFTGVQFDGLVEGVLSLRATNEFVRDWVERHFLPTLTDFVRGSAWQHQLMGEVPFLYNGVTARRPDRRYGIVPFQAAAESHADRPRHQLGTPVPTPNDRSPLHHPCRQALRPPLPG